MLSAARFLRLPLFLLLSFSSCRIQFIGNGRVISVAVTPANPTIAVGGTQPFTAHVVQKDGLTFQTTGARWSTSNPRVATINSVGVATGIGAGTATITATVELVSGSTTLTVKASTPHTVAVQGGAGKLEITFPATETSYLYAANPLDDSISVFRRDAHRGTGQIEGSEESVSTVSVYPGRGPVWLAVHPLGKYLYVLNRVSNDISVFAIDPGTGSLQMVVGSPFPCADNAWTVAVDSAAEFVEVADIKASAVIRYHIDPYTGALAPTGESR